MKERFFSGAQPTGRLHIGNYFGAIKNWVRLQDKYECIFGIVDYHAITVSYNPQEMKNRILDCAISYLACGIDPEKSILMLQSLVPEHTELAWILNTVTPLAWLERVPTFKEKVSQHPQNINAGLLDYPVLMAADILLYKSVVVPVGEDQLPHLELTREIARKFNGTFGYTFPEPKEIVGKGARILGLDGINKMSKSLNNCIYLNDSPEVLWKKLSTAVTDTNRKRRKDPGNPDICNLFSMHKLVSKKEEIEMIRKGCQTAEIGCLDCKKILAENMSREFEPIREKQNMLWKDLQKVEDILREGSNKARIIACLTLREVKEKIGVYFG